MQADAQDQWGQLKKDAQFSPAAIEYKHKETQQTAHATIGKGEIIVRNAPNSSLSGLNRDVANSITEKTTVNVNTKIDPMFDYVDAFITAKNGPKIANEGVKFLNAPSPYLGNAWAKFVKTIPWGSTRSTTSSSTVLYDTSPQTPRSAQGEK